MLSVAADTLLLLSSVVFLMLFFSDMLKQIGVKVPWFPGEMPLGQDLVRSLFWAPGDFPDGSGGKESARNAGDTRDGVRSPSWEDPPGAGNGNPVFLPGKSHGQRSLADCSPWSRKDQTQCGN